MRSPAGRKAHRLPHLFNKKNYNKNSPRAPRASARRCRGRSRAAPGPWIVYFGFSFLWIRRPWACALASLVQGGHLEVPGNLQITSLNEFSRSASTRRTKYKELEEIGDYLIAPQADHEVDGLLELVCPRGPSPQPPREAVREELQHRGPR